jgi:hypothetical protein
MNGELASSDIDVVIIGAKLAEGFGRSGKLTQFLVALKDDDSDTFIRKFTHTKHALIFASRATQLVS